MKSSVQDSKSDRLALQYVKAKFYYAVQLASRSQPSSRPNSITISSWRPAREQICDQLASRSAISSRAGRGSASEQDSVIEYGLNRSAASFELSRHGEVAQTSLRQVENHVCDQVCDLDSVMEFSLKQVAYQLVNQLASQLAS